MKPNSAKPSEVLLAAKTKIEAGWCQDVLARDEGENPCWFSDTKVAKWCSIGASYAACDDLAEPGEMACETTKSVAYVLKALGLETELQLIQWNDTAERTSTEVIEAFKQAYQLAVKDEE